jgi:hypothetical protein
LAFRGGTAELFVLRGYFSVSPGGWCPILEDLPPRYPETSGTNHQVTLRNIPEGQTSQPYSSSADNLIDDNKTARSQKSFFLTCHKIFTNITYFYCTPVV